VWIEEGLLCIHSVFGETKKLNKVGRFEERASQIMKIKNKIDVNEIYLPIEEIMFQVVKESE